MKLVFMGTPDFAVPALEAVDDAGHDVVAVYTQPPRPAGRGKRDRLSPVHKVALKRDMAVRHPASLRSVEEQAGFAALHADVAVVAAYGLILPQAILTLPRYGCLNIHASLLPRWRGAAPIHRAVMAGDAETGVCIMQMEAGLDTGPVLLSAETLIGPHTTTGELHDKLAKMGADLILRALDRLTEITPVPQPDTGVTYAKKIDKAEARIDWSRPAIEVDRQIRGLSPFPGAWFEAGDERIKALHSRLADGTGAPGTVLDGTTVACGTGAVTLTKLQRAGRRPMTPEDFLRGMALPGVLG